LLLQVDLVAADVRVHVQTTRTLSDVTELRTLAVAAVLVLQDSHKPRAVLVVQA
jgi:hypothetical protein